MQFAGSVNTDIIANPAAIIPIVNGIDAAWFVNVLGTQVDTQPNPFPTVPSTIKHQPVYTNHYYYPGLGNSYVMNAGFGETPTHRQIQYATYDIPSIQLTIRRGVSPDVIALWQINAANLGQAAGS
jgi:hypothetical protein